MKTARTMTVLLLMAWAVAVSRAVPAMEAPRTTWQIPASEEIQSLLRERLQRNGVGIVVGVIGPEGRRVVAAGRSDAPDGRLDGGTIFQIGSLTKTFTGLLLADMIERGEVSIDDELQKYLPPDVRLIVRGRPITLLDVVTHRSGLPSMPDNLRLDAQPNPVAGYTVDELYDFLRHFQPKRAPGEKYEYSNLAVAVMGRALSRHAGMDYEALLMQRVLEPLGLESTAITTPRAWSRRVARGHGPYLFAVDTPEMVAMPASGSLRSTADDMLRYIAAYLGYETMPLAAAMRRQLETASPLDERSRIAWGAQQIGGREIYAHDGGKIGFRSAVAFDVKARTGVVVLMNARTDDRAMPLAIHLLTGQALPPAPAAPVKTRIKLPPRALDRFAGSYETAGGERYAVVRNSDQLLVDYGRGNILEFAPSGPRDLFYIGGNDDITFEANSTGEITGMRIYPDGRDAGASELATKVPARHGSGVGAR
jgi:CubicO group peptidase (beta-lactamase class C family)